MTTTTTTAGSMTVQTLNAKAVEEVALQMRCARKLGMRVKYDDIEAWAARLTAAVSGTAPPPEVSAWRMVMDAAEASERWGTTTGTNLDRVLALINPAPPTSAPTPAGESGDVQCGDCDVTEWATGEKCAEHKEAQPRAAAQEAGIDVKEVKEIIAKYVGRTSRIYLYIANDLAKAHHEALTAARRARGGSHD